MCCSFGTFHRRWPRILFRFLLFSLYFSFTFSLSRTFHPLSLLLLRLHFSSFFAACLFSLCPFFVDCIFKCGFPFLRFEISFFSLLSLPYTHISQLCSLFDIDFAIFMFITTFAVQCVLLICNFPFDCCPCCLLLDAWARYARTSPSNYPRSMFYSLDVLDSNHQTVCTVQIFFSLSLYVFSFSFSFDYIHIYIECMREEEGRQRELFVFHL